MLDIQLLHAGIDAVRARLATRGHVLNVTAFQKTQDLADPDAGFAGGAQLRCFRISVVNCFPYFKDSHHA